MFEQFTYRGRRVLVLAQEEARSFNHSHLGTEHFLLGLLRLQDGLAAAVLEELGVAINPARSQVINHVGPSKQPPPGESTSESEGHVPFTTRAKEALELALQERTQLGDDEVDTAHLLLALLRPQGAIGAQVLRAMDANPALVRHRITEASRDSPDAPKRDDQRRERLRSDLENLLEENARLHTEVTRLRELLLRHGIDPGSDT